MLWRCFEGSSYKLELEQILQCHCVGFLTISLFEETTGLLRLPGLLGLLGSLAMRGAWMAAGGPFAYGTSAADSSDFCCWLVLIFELSIVNWDF